MATTVPASSSTGYGGGSGSLGAKLRAPGFPRAAWMMVLGVAFAFFLTWVVRMSNGHGQYKHFIDGEAILTVSLIAVPLTFLVGLGGFDYWFYWAAGRKTRPEDHSGHGAYTWKDYFRINTDHKVIGIQYTCSSFFFLLVGGLIAMLMRAELAAPGAQFVDANTYNGLFSVHASLLIFLFVIPVFAGLGNFVIPLMIGAPDMAFPRLNALSFWLLPVAGLMMLGSFFAPGGAFADGWTAYAPLSTDAPVGQTFFSLAVQFAGASSIMTALNFLVTIITMRAPGMSFFRMPLLVWANFATSLLVVIATPFIAASQFFVLLDHALGFNFFNAAKGGDVLMYQHVFWFYSHPAVYIMMLPGFGIISEVIAVKSRKPIFGYRMMAFSLLAIVGLGFTVWAHHMFTSGMAAWIRIPMAITTAIIAVPTGIKIFSWLATLWRGVLHLDTPMLFALGFLTTFTLGGISGVMLAMIPFDIHVSATYFIVAHIHYVLFGGSLMTIFAGVYYWFPKMTGRMFDERLGKWHFWSTFVFFNLTFGPMHVLGLQGMPRRVEDYASKFADLNLFISIASFGLGLSTLIFIYNMVTSWRGGPVATKNPWRGMTLEWQVSSPPPVFNFDKVPTVVGGPYEYGVPGAVHGTFAPTPKPATVGAAGAAQPAGSGE
ncbi:MAG TPA: cytochrome c oxidase subunit I [Solirubrobacteraceae bacterium]|nr:cytochrome c oxidase subunit I [Solirubrobacteraceae bacterium]